MGVCKKGWYYHKLWKLVKYYRKIVCRSYCRELWGFFEELSLTQMSDLEIICRHNRLYVDSLVVVRSKEETALKRAANELLRS